MFSIKHSLKLILLLFFLFFTLTPPSSSATGWNTPRVIGPLLFQPGQLYAKGEILVKIKPNRNITKANMVFGGKTVSYNFRNNVQKITLPRNSSIFEALFYYGADPNVEYAEPNYLRNPTYTPNDPALNNLGWVEQCQFKRAWDIGRGDPSVVVAIIDSGIDKDHPDLINKIVSPYNSVIRSTSISTVKDFIGHGTHVAGVAAAELNNNYGYAGAGGNVKIMPIKAYTEDEGFYDSDLAEAIYWAVDNGARVINMSLGGEESTQTLADAVNYAFENDVVIIAAGGNEGNNKPFYPAAYDGVIGVAAINTNSIVTDYSSFGNFIDLSASGLASSTTPTYPSEDGYYNPYGDSMEGTSVSSPIVAGLAGLVISLNPSLSRNEVTNLLFNNTVDIGYPGWDEKSGWGIIDACKTMLDAGNYGSLDVMETSPADDETNVFRDCPIEITFAQDISPGPNYDNITMKSGYNPAFKINTKTIDGNKLTLTPNELSSGTYTVYLPWGVVGNGENSFNAEYSFDITVGSLYKNNLSILSIDPANGSVGVSLNKALTFNFNYDVIGGPNLNNIYLTKSGGETVSLTKTLSGRKLILKPQTSLQPTSTYGLSLPSDAVRNAESGATTNASIVFITSSEVPLSFREAVNYQTAGTSGGAPLHISSADLDRDGKKDLVVTNSFSFSRLLGKGDGTFWNYFTFGSNRNGQSSLCTDYDGDGRLEIILAETYNLSLYEDNQAYNMYQSGTTPCSLSPGDFNGDGVSDLAVANKGSASITIYLSQNTFLYGWGTNYSTESTPSYINTGEFNGDGQPDLVVANSGSSTVSVFLGNSNGTFQEKRDFATGSSPVAVVVGDFNNDRHQDLATANSQVNTFSILTGNGDGTFESKEDYATGNEPYSLSLGDFNNDSKDDLAVANHGANTVSVFRGNGDGSFQPQTDFLVGSNPSFVIAGDYNNDGKDDIITANTGSNNISVLINDGIAASPTGSINIKGKPKVNIPQVEITIDTNNGSGPVSLMQFSNDGITWDAWESYTSTKSWTLSAGNGLKTVYARFKDDAGNVSDIYSDTISVDLSTLVFSSSTPTANSNSVEVNNSLSIYFNRSVTPGHDWENIILVDKENENESIILTKSSIYGYLILTPTVELKDYRNYSLVIPANAIKDVYGNYLAEPYILNFKTKDITPPTGSVIINGGVLFTKSRNVTLTLFASDNSGEIAGMLPWNESLEDWGNWAPFTVTKTWSLPSGDGEKTVCVDIKDNADNWTRLRDTILLDTTSPSSSMSVPGISSSLRNKTSFPISWTASDGNGSGVSTYDVSYRINSPSASLKSWITATTLKTKDFTGVAGNTYYFTVRACDKAGNAKWSTLYKSIVPYDNNSLISSRYGFSAISSNSKSSHYLGTLRYSTRANESITYRFTGKSASLLVYKGPGRSQAKIYIDGKYIRTVDTYAKTASFRQVIFSKSWTNSGTHTIKIVNLGTKNRSRFDIDGLAVGK